ncbi:MAG: hypothetical protein VB049_09770 [Candidatus Pelethousia sp.]|nr:hypothetical protein [Candidatus Pelethousia sp.]
MSDNGLVRLRSRVGMYTALHETLTAFDVSLLDAVTTGTKPILPAIFFSYHYNTAAGLVKLKKAGIYPALCPGSLSFLCRTIQAPRQTTRSKMTLTASVSRTEEPVVGGFAEEALPVERRRTLEGWIWR